MRNNFIAVASATLWASDNGFDCGICLWSACDTSVYHNTVASTEAPYSSIEWRFDTASVDLRNNLVTHNLLERGGSATMSGNVESASLDMFMSVADGDLHLTAGATDAIDMGDALPAGACDDDIDEDARDGSPDVGADELI